MFSKLRSKKGVFHILWFTPATSVFLCIATTLTSIAMLPKVKAAHRERKAVEFCIAEGQTQEFCSEAVSEMTRKEILDYIRDDQPVTRESLNKGVFVGGNMNG